MFSKNQKNPILGTFWALLAKFGQKWISLKKKGALSVFKYSNNLPLCQKLEKNNQPFLRKMANWRTDRWTDNQTERRGFIGSFVRRGSNKSGLELVISPFSSYEIKFKKVPLLVWYYLTKFDNAIKNSF